MHPIYSCIFLYIYIHLCILMYSRIDMSDAYTYALVNIYQTCMFTGSRRLYFHVHTYICKMHTHMH